MLIVKIIFILVLLVILFVLRMKMNFAVIEEYKTIKTLLEIDYWRITKGFFKKRIILYFYLLSLLFSLLVLFDFLR